MIHNVGCRVQAIQAWSPHAIGTVDELFAKRRGTGPLWGSETRRKNVENHRALIHLFLCCRKRELRSRSHQERRIGTINLQPLQALLGPPLLFSRSLQRRQSYPAQRLVLRSAQALLQEVQVRGVRIVSRL